MVELILEGLITEGTMLVRNKLAKRVVMVMLGIMVVVVAMVVCSGVLIWAYEGKSFMDEDLFCTARRCFSEEVVTTDFAKEAMVYFMNTNLWDSQSHAVWPRECSSMAKVGHSLPASTHYWCTVKFRDAYALALRFGCHSNYAYLVVVNQNESEDDNADVRCVTNNVLIVFNRQLLQGL